MSVVGLVCGILQLQTFMADVPDVTVAAVAGICRERKVNAVSLAVFDFGFPGIDITLFGETFKWNIIGYDAAHGGLPYFCAYMIAMVVGECINFPIQRSFVFRSKGNIWYQGMWYLIAFCIVTCIVNSINCIWVAVAGMFVPDWLYNIGTTVLNGGVSMVVFFFVNKIIFPEGEAKKAEA